MAKCRVCGATLRSGNDSKFCSVHQPPEKVKPIPAFHFVPRNNKEKHAWERFMMKIRVEVAQAFPPVTVTDLEHKELPAGHPAQLACLLLLTDFFRAPLSTVARYLTGHRASADVRDKAQRLCRHDADFQDRYETVCRALERMDKDVIPEAVRASFTPLRREADDLTYGTAADAIMERGSLRMRHKRIGDPDYHL
ncbi:MAG: hypothetical protein AAB533_02040 [Patescibacteria group bacterium]